MSERWSGPSEAAVQVAADAVGGSPRDPSAAYKAAARGRAEVALAAAHDPANFEDRRDVSVRLGDVVERIYAGGEVTTDFGRACREIVADLLRTFGGTR